ncbi:serine/threonine-protein kinase MAK-like [Xyrichtys novacula]|nr:serine/threonine-protein kinase MAK-like [Xyrichtys novacula]
MKPENLLCMGPELVKIADFGLAREIRSRPPYTVYVSTRWYRAPEILLKSNSYSSPIDIWAVGCIMAELYTLRPLFPGNSEVEEIFKICQVLGTLKKSDWPEGYNLALALNFRFPKSVPASFRSLIPNASNDAIALMKDMLQWDPERRPSAAQALRYPYFHVGQALLAPLKYSGNHTTQSKLSEDAPETKPLSLCKSDLESVKPRKTHAEMQSSIQAPHQPLQQIPLPQENQEPSMKPGVCSTVLTEGQEEPLSLVKKKQLTNLQSPGMRAGRRRWGQTSIKSVSSVDGSEDTGVSLSKKTTISSVKQRELDGPSSKAELPNSELNRGNAATLSAKQHYLRQSRYLPGVNPRKKSSSENQAVKRNILGSSLSKGPGPEFPSSKDISFPKLTETQPLGEKILEDLDLPKDSFMSNSNWTVKTHLTPLERTETGAARHRVTGTSAVDLSLAADLRVQTKTKTPKSKTFSSKLLSSNDEYDGCRSRNAQIPTSSSTGKKTFTRNTNLQPVHGRTDWTAKYRSHQ